MDRPHVLGRGSGVTILCAVHFQPHFRSAHICTSSHPKIPTCIDTLDLCAQKLYWLVYWICLVVLKKYTAGSSADVTRKRRTHLTSNNCHGNQVVAHSITNLERIYSVDEDDTNKF